MRRPLAAVALVISTLLVLPAAAFAAAELSIAKTDSADPVTNLDDLTYTLKVDNAGPDPATGVVVLDDLPDGLTIKSLGPGCSFFAGSVACQAASIADGTSASFNFTVTPELSFNPLTGDPPGTIMNTATVSADEMDTNPLDSSDTETTGVRARYDILAIADASEPVFRGRPFNYDVAVVNFGPDQVSGATVSAELPASVDFVSASPECTVAAGTVTCSAPTLSATGEQEAKFNVRVLPNQAGRITTEVTVAAPSGTALQEEKATANNSKTLETTVGRKSPQAEKRCRGNTATIVDRGRGGTIRGTPGRDVIIAGRGNDIVRARGGDDIVCGGPGGDSIRGQGGPDRIYGDDGNDRLIGGGGGDSCVGGKDRDIKTSCEFGGIKTESGR